MSETFGKAKIFFVLDVTGEDFSNWKIVRDVKGEDFSNWNFAIDVKGIFRPQSFSRSECNHDTSWLPWQSGKGCSDFDPLASPKVDNQTIAYVYLKYTWTKRKTLTWDSSVALLSPTCSTFYDICFLYCSPKQKWSLTLKTQVLLLNMFRYIQEYWRQIPALPQAYLKHTFWIFGTSQENIGHIS